MKRHYFTSYYLALTGCFSALLIVMSLVTVFIKFDNTSFQLADGLYLTLVSIIPGPMMLLVGIIYPLVFDLISGGFLFIPLSITIHCLMFILIRTLQGKVSVFLLFIIASLLIFMYVPFNYLINCRLDLKIAQAMTIKELIVDSIQYVLTVIIAMMLRLVFKRTKFDNYLKRKLVNSL